MLGHNLQGPSIASAYEDFPLQQQLMTKEQRKQQVQQQHVRAHTAVDDAEVETTLVTVDSWLSGTGIDGENPEKEEEKDFVFLSFFFSCCADSFST